MDGVNFRSEIKILSLLFSFYSKNVDSMIREMIKIQYCPFKRDLPLIVSARDLSENSDQYMFRL